MLRARGELVLMADADGATVVSDVEQLEEALSRVASPPAKVIAVESCKAFILREGTMACTLPSKRLAALCVLWPHWLHNLQLHMEHCA